MDPRLRNSESHATVMSAVCQDQCLPALILSAYNLYMEQSASTRSQMLFFKRHVMTYM